MDHISIRQRFTDFFEARGHSLVPSSSLLPSDDPSVLLTTAGMQQFKPYFVGLKDPSQDFGSRNTVSIQKCFRTADIDDVGDDTHLTFFEMMGNFSFGGYWKPEAIQYAWEFLTSPDGASIDPSRISATYYNGDRPGTSADTESLAILQSIPNLATITPQGAEDNFWGPTGSEGPCGPTVEFYVDGVEVWNVVFNEFYSTPDQKLTALESRGIDTGMGLERLLVAINKSQGVFGTSVFQPTVSLLGNLPHHLQRVIADHARGTVFLLSDHVVPSNKEQGYILRRILRRLLIHIQDSGVGLESILESVIDNFSGAYPELATGRQQILSAAREEADKFSRTLDAGRRELDKVIERGGSLTGEEAFKLFSTFGLPIDYIKERTQVDLDGFEQAFKSHQELSRAGAEQKFGGHGLSAGAQVSDEDKQKITALHTATHLLHAALHHVLGSDAAQSGSDITPERTRFDFSFPRKLTEEEKSAIESWVNSRIQDGFVVTKTSLPYAEAIASGAIAFFKEKYPETVTVYTIENKEKHEVISRELCGGPHVETSQELGKFRILKEESSSAGIRRIKAVLE